MSFFKRLTLGRALVLGCALASLYYMFLFDSGSSLKEQLQATKNEITSLQTQLEADQAKLDRAAKFKVIAMQVGTTINKLLSVIPENFGASDLMRIVSNETKVAGSSLNNITPFAPENSGVSKEFEELAVSVNVTGSFLQHMVFLSNLTKVSQILVIRKLDLTTDREGDETPVVAMSAEIVAFRYRNLPPEPKPKPAAQPGEGE